MDARDTMGNWYQSVVKEARQDEVKVHYEGWKPRWDAWVGRSDVAPLFRHTRPWRDFRSGDCVDANPHTRDDHTAWAEASVEKVDAQRVLVRFFSGLEKWFTRQ